MYDREAGKALGDNFRKSGEAQSRILSDRVTREAAERKAIERRKAAETEDPEPNIVRGYN